MSLNEQAPDPVATDVDALEAQLAELQAHFEGQEPESEPAEPEPAEPEPESEPEPAQPEGDPAAAPGRVSLLGREFDTAQAESLIGFYDWVRAHPDQAIAIDAYMRGQAQFVVPEAAPAAPAPQAPEPDELEGLPQSVIDKLAEIDELRRQVGTVANDSMARRQAEAQAVVNAAGQSFAGKYGLNEAEVEELQREAAALNVIPGFIAQGAQWGAAVEEALDVAYWRNPKYREAHAERIASQAKKDQDRQRKAASLSGGSGSAPRTPNPADTETPEGRRAAIVAAISAAQNGSGQ